AAVPHDHRPAAVLSFWDCAFKFKIFEGMIFGPDRETLFCDNEARSLWNRPTQQDPIELKSKIVVEPPCRMLLDHKSRATFDLHRRLGLGRAGEISPPAIAFQRVGWRVRTQDRLGSTHDRLWRRELREKSRYGATTPSIMSGASARGHL